MIVQQKIDPKEFELLKNYIEQNCGIHLTKEKMYLVETRLTTLMVENGCNSYTELYLKAVADKQYILRDKIIDAMTTNETLWFRDTFPYTIFDEIILNQMAQQFSQGIRSKIRIWSAACSTGQEPYSLAMKISEWCQKSTLIKPHQIEILATDISPTVLFLAKAGRYDSIAISRGLNDYFKHKYFVPQGKVWVIKDEIKKMVTIKKFNLQEDFSLFGKMDIIFCRNVLIYFSDTFKIDIFKRMARLLRPKGYLFLGSSESIINYSTEYTMQQHQRGLYYQVKD